MAKNVDEVIRGLKLKDKKTTTVSMKLGVRRYELPFEVRVLASDNYAFVHIPPEAQILKIQDGKLVAVQDLNEAIEARDSFRKPRTRTAKRASRKSTLEVPPAIEDALKMVPAGYKLVIRADGKPAIVKMRTRRKKS